MRGFVHKRTHTRTDGRPSILYYAVIETTDVGSAKRRQDWGKGYATRREADRALRDRVAAVEARSFIGGNRFTVGEYLVDQWLPLQKDRVKTTTLNSYQRTIEGYVVPRIGRLRLQDLSATHLNSLYADLRTRGGTWQSAAKKKQGADKPLSPKTVRNVHAILSKALNDAVDTGLILSNCAARAKPPRARSVSENVDAWTAEELTQFLASVRGDRLSAAWHLTAYTGVRRGELLGLRWSDLDLSSRTLSVRQTLILDYSTPTFSTPKNHEARVINLDEETSAVLEQHRTTQQVERREWGEGYLDSGLVFRREDGSLIHPDRLSQLFDKFVRKSGIRRIKFHGLRHTHATLMLKAGVPVKVVSERLGHADPAFTLRVYQHVQSGMQADAARVFAEMLSTSRADGPEEPSAPTR